MLQDVLLLLLDCGIKVHLFSLSQHLHDFIFVILLNFFRLGFVLVASDFLGHIVLWLHRVHHDILLVEVRFTLENVLHVWLLVDLHLFLFLVGLRHGVFVDVKVVHSGPHSLLFNFRLNVFRTLLSRRVSSVELEATRLLEPT